MMDRVLWWSFLQGNGSNRSQVVWEVRVCEELDVGEATTANLTMGAALLWGKELTGRRGGAALRSIYLNRFDLIRAPPPACLRCDGHAALCLVETLNLGANSPGCSRKKIRMMCTVVL